MASLRDLLAAALDANRELARLTAELRAENERLRAENAEQAAELGTLHADLASAGSPRRPGAHHHPATYRITSVSRALLAEFKARVSFMFAGRCRWRSLAVDGGSGTSRGHAPVGVGQVIGAAAPSNDRPFSGRACPSA